MLVTRSWLSKWVDLNLSDTELADTLTTVGLEVEGCNVVASGLDHVVVGEVLSLAPHPEADRLQLCEVDTGAAEPLRIVCGARNVAAKRKVIVACVGAKLGELTIKASTIRGEASNGMLCSASELGLEESSDGLLLLDDKAPVGTSISDYLQLDDVVFELGLTPNRGDCLGALGVARDLAAVQGLALREFTATEVAVSHDSVLPIRLDAPEGCPRYVGRAVFGIDMQARTPDWMREQLRRVGLRSINPVVDITNYVMLELGQPMHAFDFHQISGGIVVRNAQSGERITLLDGSEKTLQADDLVIADHEKAIALAGIMGGQQSAINDDTKDIYFESAFFPPKTIIGKARRIGMHTDASHRYERGVDFAGQMRAMQRASELLIEICGGRAGPITEQVVDEAMPTFADVVLTRHNLDRSLGISVPSEQVSQILNGLGLICESQTDRWLVNIPSWRHDITGEHDLVEEVARCYGLHNIPGNHPSSVASSGKHLEASVNPMRLKNLLVAGGFYEAITYSFVDPLRQQTLLSEQQSLTLLNPIASNMSEMRQSLLPGLLDALQHNLNRQQQRVQLFEAGHVFIADTSSDTGCREQEMLAAVVSGDVSAKSWSSTPRQYDFYDIKGIVETLFASVGITDISFEKSSHHAYHPGQSADIYQAGVCLGQVGQLHPKHLQTWSLEQPVFAFECAVAPLLNQRIPRFSAISRFPALSRDLAIVAERSISADDIYKVIEEIGGNLLKKIIIFDVYSGDSVGENSKSYAYNLLFQSSERNLTSEEVDATISHITDALSKDLGAELRS